MATNNKTQKTIFATEKHAAIIALDAPVSILAAEGDGEKRGPSRFEVEAYTGGPMPIEGYDLPVVIDLAGLEFGKSLVANLDHDKSKRVGNVKSHAIEGGKLILSGVASAATPYRNEVVQSAVDGFTWQASVEVTPKSISEVAKGAQREVNGQTITGPAYVVDQGKLKGFAFVSHGADDNTIVSIAASAANTGGSVMRAEVKAWINKLVPSIDVGELSADEVKNIEADYDGREGSRNVEKTKPANIFAERKAERDRQETIRETADEFCEKRPHDIEAIEKMYQHAIDTKMEPREFRYELIEATIPESHTISQPRTKERGINAKVIEAAILKAGRHPQVDKLFDEQTLELADSKFRNGIGLKELFILCAEANGYRAPGYNVTIETQRAAFGMTGGRPIHAQGWSTLNIATIVSNTANKFLRDGWSMVDMTPMEIASVRSVRDFKQITTVSLTGDLEYEKLGAAGEIKHGTLGEETYTNQVDTYARMLAITRRDIVNDDVGALTDVPRRLGRGAALKLNDIFWTEFLGLVSANFFSAGNANINTGVATMTIAGLTATELIFMDQTDPDGKPLGVMPKILLVPTALKAAAMTLMESQRLIDGTGTAVQGDANVYRGRFRVLSSPYISNAAYTGSTSVGYWMLADPNEVPVIEIAALNGRVEPTVETADADFNTLGVQMRGYSDVGVNEQEYRGGVFADGGSS